MFLKVDAHLIWTLVNLALLVFLAKRFLFKPLRAMMDQRHALITSQLEEARAKEQEAASLRAQSDQWVADAHRKAGRIVDAARDRGDEAYDHIVAQARRVARHLTEETRVKIARDEAEARERLRAETADLALLMASRMVEKSWTEETDAEMVRRFLEEA